jgi:hypothetical protein
MPSFPPLLRRSPRTPKNADLQGSSKGAETDDDVAGVERDGAKGSNPARGRATETTHGEGKERRSSKRDLLHGLRSRLVGKPSSTMTPQRGRAASQPQPQQGTRVVRWKVLITLSPVPFFTPSQCLSASNWAFTPHGTLLLAAVCST